MRFFNVRLQHCVYVPRGVLDCCARAVNGLGDGLRVRVRPILDADTVYGGCRCAAFQGRGPEIGVLYP